MQIPIVHFNDVLDGEPSSAVALERTGELDLAPVRAAQQQWVSTSVRERLRVIKNFRHALATRSTELVRALRPAGETEAAEILSAQIIPLAEACRFLEREAEKILAPNRRPHGSVPLWLRDTRAEVHREPCGVVLVVAPSNYPVFLPGVVLVQALAAGNAVLLKPAPGGGAAADALLKLLHAAELPVALVTKLDEHAGAVHDALAAGVDKVVFTGSAATGQKILHACAQQLVPATMELSGCDAMFVRADADVPLAARALHFGLRLNRGATCIAPRRVFVHESRAAEFEAECLHCFAEGPTWTQPGAGSNPKPNSRTDEGPVPLTPALSLGERENGIQPHQNLARPFIRTLNDCLPLPEGEGRGKGKRDSTSPKNLSSNQAGAEFLSIAKLVIEATAQGARVLIGKVNSLGEVTLPLLVIDAKPGLRLLREDHFSAVAAVVRVSSDRDALAANDECPYALGASVFSVDEGAARAFAARINAGSVVINDLIAPTADPRLPFGGRQQSGFGVTRGAEGLLDLTVPKVVSTRRGHWRPHYAAPRDGDAEFFTHFLSLTHAPKWSTRLKSALALFRAARQRRKS